MVVPTNDIFAAPEVLEASRQANGHTGQVDSDGRPAYKVINQYHSEKQPLRCICIGAGASGLAVAYKMEKMTEGVDLQIYEKNHDIGGTWLENRYPGCACDIPAHIYTYSWEPNPNWSTFYAYSPEIQDYYKGFCAKHNLMRFIKLNHKVLSATWKEEEGKYIVKIQKENGEIFEDWCNTLINGSGVLNNWKWPEIEGLHSFEGPLMHSAAYDENVDVKGKRVAVIGTGSSSIQIVAKLQPQVKELVAFIRSATWISPPISAAVNYEVQGKDMTTTENARERQYVFTEEEKKRFREDPEYHLQFRKKLEAEINARNPVFQMGTEIQIQAMAYMKDEMERRIGPGNEELKERMIPKWAPGCRRLTPGDGYLEALVQPNCTKVYSDIAKITPKGLVDADGILHEVDIIVCATGFNVAFVPHFDLFGVNGVSIKEDWSPEPNCYMGLAAPRFPNYFVIMGPRGPWGNGAVLPAMECMIEYAMKAMTKMQQDQIRALEPKQEAVDDLMEHIDEWQKSSVWQQPCRSWYKNNKVVGRAWTWCGTSVSFIRTMREPRWEDYNIRYKNRNRYAYIGNGNVKASMRGLPPHHDIDGLSPFIRNDDGPWVLE